MPERQCGTANLKHYLADLLCRRIRKSFPTMQDKVREMLAKERNRIKKFGQPRTSTAQQKSHLISIVNSYQSLAYKSLQNPGELPEDNVKLRGMIRNLKLDFNNEMMRSGLRYAFLAIGDPVEFECIDDSDSDVSEDLTKPNVSLSIPCSPQQIS